MIDAMDAVTEGRLFVLFGIVFMSATATMIICGLMFDFLLERRHRARTGCPLMEPAVPMPLLTGFYCGMQLIAPRWGLSRGHESPFIWQAGRCNGPRASTRSRCS